MRRSEKSKTSQEARGTAEPIETLVFDVSAALNREELDLPAPNGPNGQRVLDLEMLLNHAFYWDWLTERETEEVLMELYIARTRRSQ